MPLGFVLIVEKEWHAKEKPFLDFFPLSDFYVIHIFLFDRRQKKRNG